MSTNGWLRKSDWLRLSGRVRVRSIRIVRSGPHPWYRTSGPMASNQRVSIFGTKGWAHTFDEIYMRTLRGTGTWYGLCVDFSYLTVISTHRHPAHPVSDSSSYQWRYTSSAVRNLGTEATSQCSKGSGQCNVKRAGYEKDMCLLGSRANSLRGRKRNNEGKKKKAYQGTGLLTASCCMVVETVAKYLYAFFTVCQVWWCNSPLIAGIGSSYP